MKTVKKLLMAVFALAVITTAALPKEVKAGGGGLTYTYTGNDSSSYWEGDQEFTLKSGESKNIYCANSSGSSIGLFLAENGPKGERIALKGKPSSIQTGDSGGFKVSYSACEEDLNDKGYTDVPDSLDIKVSAYYSDSDGGVFLVCDISFPASPSSDSGDDEKVFTDYDTYKSELPSHTVLATLNKNYSDDYKMDMKAHAPSAATAANQSLLADAFAKSYNKTKNIIWSWDIFAKRDLTLSENGGRYEININTKVTGQAGTVYMECYSPEDKAYTLVGTMDDKGVATFDNFILRPATSVTIFTLK